MVTSYQTICYTKKKKKKRIKIAEKRMKMPTFACQSTAIHSSAFQALPVCSWIFKIIIIFCISLYILFCFVFISLRCWRRNAQLPSIFHSYQHTIYRGVEKLFCMFVFVWVPCDVLLVSFCSITLVYQRDKLSFVY